MQWAIDNIDRLRVGLLVIGAALIVANLALGPDPLATRITAVLGLAVVVPFLYFMTRWVLKLQIRQHGLRPWIIQFGTLLFYVFGIGAIVGVALLVAGIGKQTPIAATAIAPAVFAYSAAATIRQARQKANVERNAG